MSKARTKTQARAEVAHRALFAYHPRYGYSFRKNLDVRGVSPDPRFASFQVSTNDAGFRSAHDNAAFAASAKIKILLLGCSFAAGHGVGNSARFSDLLEQRLGNVTIYNAALPGSGHDQQHLILEELIGVLKPDYVVLGGYTGCAMRNTKYARSFYNPFYGAMTQRPKPYYELQNGALVLKNVPVPKWLRQNGAEEKTGAFAVLSRKLKSYLQGTSAEEKLYAGGQGYELTRAILKTSIEKIEGAGAKAILMPLPSQKDLVTDTPAYCAFFEMLANETRAAFIDVHAPLKKFHDEHKNAAFLKNDGHYTPQAQAFLATELAQKLGAVLR